MSFIIFSAVYETENNVIEEEYNKEEVFTKNGKPRILEEAGNNDQKGMPIGVFSYYVGITFKEFTDALLVVLFVVIDFMILLILILSVCLFFPYFLAFIKWCCKKNFTFINCCCKTTKEKIEQFKRKYLTKNEINNQASKNEKNNNKPLSEGKNTVIELNLPTKEQVEEAYQKPIKKKIKYVRDFATNTKNDTDKLSERTIFIPSENIDQSTNKNIDQSTNNTRNDTSSTSRKRVRISSTCNKNPLKTVHEAKLETETD